ncbi:hypothetical protein DFH28DRAFT_971385 [Melampsora americana]|nr:hypothetical protein DFH28DRAFT_971385 [Melampsora americana]
MQILGFRTGFLIWVALECLRAPSHPTSCPIPLISTSVNLTQIPENSINQAPTVLVLAKLFQLHLTSITLDHF